MRTCVICSSGHTRPAIDAMLASSTRSSPRRISGIFPRFSRQQIRLHRDECLGGVPRTMFALKRGDLTEEGIAQKLRAQGKPEEEIENILAVVDRLKVSGNVR